MDIKSCAVVAVVAVLLQMMVVEGSTCPPNTQRFENKCYSFRKHGKTWHEASKECERMSGQLVAINRRSLNDFIKKTYKKPEANNLWIGLMRCGSSWCYPNGRTYVYRSWSFTEPNNYGGKENCVDMKRYGYWKDTNCQLKRPFVCEIPVDVDECALGTGICDPKATCKNTVGSYTCICKPGFTGTGIQTTCNDTNECLTEVNSCHAVAKCINTYGSYICKCPDGYVGDGKNCIKDCNPKEAAAKLVSSLLLFPSREQKIIEKLEKHNEETDKQMNYMKALLETLVGRSFTSNSTKPVNSTSSGN